MLRILLANFIVQVLPLLMIVAAVVLVVRARKRGPASSFLHYFGISLAALPLGIIIYLFAGIAAARIRGEGHFYSVPFGGFSVGSNDKVLVSSVVFWWLLWIGVLSFATRGFSTSR